MIEVRVDQTGDWAEAPSPAAAIVAAKTMLAEAWHARPTQGYKPTATFLVDGRIIRAGVPESDLWGALEGATR